MKSWIVCTALVLAMCVGAVSVGADEPAATESEDAEEYVDITTLAFDQDTLTGVIVASSLSLSLE